MRTEQPADYRETENVTREAFWNLYSPGCCEHYLLHVMRDSPAFVPELDLVAERDGRIVGNVVSLRAVLHGDDGTDCEVLSLSLAHLLWPGYGVRVMENTQVNQAPQPHEHIRPDRDTLRERMIDRMAR